MAKENKYGDVLKPLGVGDKALIDETHSKLCDEEIVIAEIPEREGEPNPMLVQINGVSYAIPLGASIRLPREVANIARARVKSESLAAKKSKEMMNIKHEMPV